MFTRICAVAIAVLGLAGCASNQEYPNEGYGYGQYPNQAYGYGQYPNQAYGYGAYPYYGGAYYGSAWPWRDDYKHFSENEFDDFYHRHQDDDRFFRPANGVICDRARDTCFDRHGIANHATKDFFGGHANRDSHNSHDNDRGDLFSPRPGVICDHRSNNCWNGNWPYSNGDVMTRQRYNERLQSDASPLGRDRHVEQRSWANNTRLPLAEEARPNQQPQYWPPATEKKSRKESNLAPLPRAMETAKPHADADQNQPLVRQKRVNEKRPPAACPPNGCAND
jgi:hypothetical protein